MGPNPLLNGVPLEQKWQNDEAHDRGKFPVRAWNGLSREVNIGWRSVCLLDEGQVLSVRILQPGDGGRPRESSGFTVSFKQDGTPAILLLKNRPTRLASKRHSLHQWLHPSEEHRLRIGGVPDFHPSALDAEFAKLAYIKSEMATLHALMREQEHTIIRMLKQDFKQCDGIQCMLQTAMQKAPDFAHLIAEHFSREKVNLKKSESEVSLMESFEFPQAPPPPAEEVGPMKENPAHPAPPPFDAEHDTHPPFEGDHPHPPFEGGFPRPPPWAEVHPPPFKGSFPHPPPWAEDHPSFKGDFPHPPPWAGEHSHSPFRGGRPPPFHGGHPPPPPPPPYYAAGAHGPPGHHHHIRPSFFHIRHGHFRILKAVLAVLAGLFLLSLLSKAIRRHIPGCGDPRRRADRASRREERRARCEYRRAAHRHRISSWWAAHNPRRRSAAGTTDYEEKRALILQQEGVLEAVMQTEIRNLEVAAELEEGRRGARVISQSRQELDGQPGTSRPNEQGFYTIEYSAPPPQYEAELDDDMMVVDGFGYTPSNTDETPDSSVVDFSPRMSTETLLTNTTNTTKSDRMD